MRRIRSPISTCRPWSLTLWIGKNPRVFSNAHRTTFEDHIPTLEHQEDMTFRKMKIMWSTHMTCSWSWLNKLTLANGRFCAITMCWCLLHRPFLSNFGLGVFFSLMVPFAVDLDMSKVLFLFVAFFLLELCLGCRVEYLSIVCDETMQFVDTFLSWGSCEYCHAYLDAGVEQWFASLKCSCGE